MCFHISSPNPGVRDEFLFFEIQYMKQHHIWLQKPRHPVDSSRVPEIGQVVDCSKQRASQFRRGPGVADDYQFCVRTSPVVETRPKRDDDRAEQQDVSLKFHLFLGTFPCWLLQLCGTRGPSRNCFISAEFYSSRFWGENMEKWWQNGGENCHVMCRVLN